MEPADADAYFGWVLRGSAKGTRLARAQALTTFFAFLELRHQVEIHAVTGRIVECPIDEMNKPRGRAARRSRPDADRAHHPSEPVRITAGAVRQQSRGVLPVR
jgi:pyridoxine/pyridoxamine 5'-phosphate oxidase